MTISNFAQALATFVLNLATCFVDACDISPSVPDVDDFFGISEEFVASLESAGFSSK